MKKFIETLKEQGIDYKIKKNLIIITKNHGYVNLGSLTTLPDNVKFENHGGVYLGSLTTLPDNVKFENHGYVNLGSLTTLPDNVKFENHGYVYLRSLTTLPDNVKFENHGYVYLGSLTTLPDNVKFENHGDVNLGSLTTLPDNVKFENHGDVDLGSLTTIDYRNKVLNLKQIDGYTMIINSKKTKGDFTIYNCRYFGGGELNKLKKVYVAEKGEYYAHGETVKQAIEDVNFKFMQNTFNLEDLISAIKAKQTININEYRMLTGACGAGVDDFRERKNIEATELSIDEVISLTKGEFGHDKIVKLLKG